MARVYVGIGSNIEPARHVCAALDDLRAAFGELDVSPVYQTEAVGFAGQDFLNLVVGFDTSADPGAVNQTLRAIEDRNGRRRGPERYASRTLDLDLLLYDDLVADDPAMNLPRDEILRFAFVLKPLADIAGERHHPSDGRTFNELWAEMADDAPALTSVDL
ncbi:2-amino-4-hydroxy-6-hydroxymethyldihydropteridine diphosphokinase [Ectothiorhodospiraceae bacterium WFHF3C12]|nr:2-amino-4-hydroxy-6-hydroxymethyldihydropteridine diphosphokinase [Ectothiorhodospiraceae bacterium WFHF3C12]